MYVLFVMFLFIFLLVIAKVILDIKEYYYDVPEYMKHKSKCYDCEKQYINMYGVDGAWKGQSSKSYAAEKQGVEQNGLAGGFIGKSIKYY